MRFERGAPPLPLLTISFVVNVGEKEVLNGKVAIPETMSKDIISAQDYARGEAFELLNAEHILGEPEVLLTIFCFGEPSRN